MSKDQPEILHLSGLGCPDCHRSSPIGELELRDWVVPNLFQQEMGYIPIPAGEGIPANKALTALKEQIVDYDDVNSGIAQRVIQGLSDNERRGVEKTYREVVLVIFIYKKSGKTLEIFIQSP
ncbi:hypothetical protein GF312_10730 [Candidatus Poribacteria bacterium]|nr:hypothetical protein [Candidatus Poribacteria bacterium]